MESVVSLLVAENKKLVFKIANRYAIGATEAREDIEAAGMLGLVKAAQRYDPAKGYKFSSIAVPWIRGEILHFFRGKGGMPKVPRSWQDIYMKGYKLPDAEAAAKNEIPLELWLEIKQGCSCWVGEWKPAYEKSWEPEAEDELIEFEQARAGLRVWLTGLGEGDRLLVEKVYFEGKSRDKHNRQKLQVILHSLNQSIPSASKSVTSA